MRAGERIAPLTCLEIFAGGGGMTLGLAQAGFAHRAVVEYEPRACETLQMNYPGLHVIMADVRRLHGDDLGDADLLCGGLPSLDRRAFDGRDLFPEMVRLAAQIHPRAVLVEGARELASSSFAGYRAQRMAEFRELGYETQWSVVQASDYGIPQPRPRCVMVAIRPPWSKLLRWPSPRPVPPPTVSEAIADLMGARGWPGMPSWREQAWRIAPTIAGGSARGGPDLGPTRARQAWRALGIDGRGIADEAPGPDFPPGQLPRLTVRMVARLQGFPDDWVFAGPKTTAYRQVSTACPPPVARVLGEAIRDVLDVAIPAQPGRADGNREPKLGKPAAAPDVMRGWESRVRDLVQSEMYEEALAVMADAPAEDPARVTRLRLECGFARLPETDRRIVAAAWGPTTTGNSFGFPPAVPAAAAVATEAPPPPLSGKKAPATRGGTGRPRRLPQRSGAVLEEATASLLGRLLAAGAADPELDLRFIRRQTAGTQYGHDIEFEFAAKGNSAVRGHVECKNIDRPVGIDDVGPKILQQDYYGRDRLVDHWILVSPHSNPGNELRKMLGSWEDEGKYPFSVQVWSPENGIRSLFALEPDAYQAIYGTKPSAEDLALAEQSAQLFHDRLAPRLRIGQEWRHYLKDPGLLCFGKEVRGDLDALFADHVELRAANERGSVLAGTLMDQVITWLSDGKPSSLLLLADFGEGKTAFTYCLARQLCAEFRRSPGNHHLPVRIPLREFKEAGTGRALLERRLAEFGARIEHWRSLTGQAPTLAILDGFDEMSSDLSPAAVTENLRGLESCVAEFSGKILVTFRRRVLDGRRDRQRILDMLGDPQVLHIAPSPRPERIRHLERFADGKKTGPVLKNLLNLYDTIGLTAKPLFLQMIKETLTELPSQDVDELILYDTYIDKSLRRKIESNQDPSLSPTHGELIGNLQEILEDIAVRLHQENEPYIYLRDQQGVPEWSMAELLWKSDQAEATRPGAEADDDATARVGIRSLLKAVPAPEEDRWPVDFFHRSMREYFVARAIVRYLHSRPDQARRILSATPLLPEITHFASMRLKKEGTTAAFSRLESFARSATPGTDPGYLGGNALTLFYLGRGEPPRFDYSGLSLDHAQLRGADLTGCRFAKASLRYANLDNANLESADFTDADLEGVQLEETSPVLALVARESDRIIAAYEDRSLREWFLRPGTEDSRVIHRLDHRADRLYLTPQERLVASGDGALSVLDLDGGGVVPRSRFGTKSCFRFIIPGQRSALFAEEQSGGVTRVSWLDVPGKQLRDHRDITEAVTCGAQLDGTMYAFGTEETVRVVRFSDDGKRHESAFRDPGVSCLDLRIDQEGVVVATGHQDGTVGVTRILLASPADDIEPPQRHHAHSGTVTAISFGADGQIISGGIDRVICVMPLPGPRPGPAEPPIRRLCLTLRCRNVRFAGVRTEREQQTLRELSLR